MDALGIIAQLGVAGLAIYYMAEQSKRNEKRMDSKDEKFHELEKEVRTNIMEQLMENTQVMNKTVTYLAISDQTRK